MKFRDRIYGGYVTSTPDIEKITDCVDFNSRGVTMRYLINNFFPKNKNSKILEIGCGHGTLIYFAKMMGYENIEGIDSSAQQVTLAKSLGITGVREGDLMCELRALDLEVLDTVVAFDVIEHFTKDELIDLVDGVHKVLKPNGSWIIHAPNARSPFFGVIQYGDFTHEQAFTEASLTQLLKNSGFREIHFVECGPIIYGVKSFLRVIVWRLTRMLLSIVNAAETGSLERNTIWTRNFYAIAIKR